MERLTYEKSRSRWNEGRCPTKYTSRHTFQEIVARLAAYEDAMPLERAQELAQAEKDGRLVVLPCKVGDTVWVILEDMKPQPARVQGISMSASCSNTILHFGGYPPVSVWGNDIGATWFSTREEAEAALKKREEADNEPLDN